MSKPNLPLKVVTNNYGKEVLDYASERGRQLYTKAVVQFVKGFENVAYQRQLLNYLSDDAVLVGFLSVPICGSDISNILLGYERERIGGNGRSGFDMEGSGVINGHEALVVVLAAGKNVNLKPGEIHMIQADMRDFDGLEAVGYRVPGGFRGLGIYGPHVQRYFVMVHSPEDGERKLGLIEASMIENMACIGASHRVGSIREDDKTILINGGGGNMASLHLKYILSSLAGGGLKSLSKIYLADVINAGMDRAIARFGGDFSEYNVELQKINVSETKLSSVIRPREVNYYIETVKQFPEQTLERCRTIMSDNGMLMAYAGMKRGDGPVVLEDGNEYSIGDLHWDCRIAKTNEGFWITGNTGSTVEDMTTILGMLKARNIYVYDDVGALCGPDAMLEGLHAMHEKKYQGKIVALPQYTELPLTDIKGLEAVGSELKIDWSAEDLKDIRAGTMSRSIDETLLAHFANKKIR